MTVTGRFGYGSEAPAVGAELGGRRGFNGPQRRMLQDLCAKTTESSTRNRMQKAADVQTHEITAPGNWPHSQAGKDA